MSTKLTRAHFEERIEAFYTFAREQGYLVTALGPGRSGRHHYLVQNEENVVEVSLTSMGNFPVSTEQGIGSQGRISSALCAWFEREGLRHAYDQPFSREACEYLSADIKHAPVHAPRVKWQGLQKGAQNRAGGGIARIRQLIPAQQGFRSY